MRTSAAAVAGTLLLLLAGCGDGDRPDAVPSGTPAPTAPSASGPEGSGSETSGSETSEETSASASVAPADGETVELPDAATLRLPSGPDWTIAGQGSRAVVARADADGGTVTVLANEFPAGVADLDSLAQVELDAHLAEGDHPSIRRGEDRDVAGVTGWVLTSQDGEDGLYQFGALSDGVYVSLAVEVTRGLSAQEWIEPVLASVEWR